MVAFVGLACAPPPPTTPGTQPQQEMPPAGQLPAPPGVQAWMAEMLGRLNAERAAVGAQPLAHCTNLDEAAGAHSVDQALHNNMSHTGSNGSNPGQRIEAAGYTNWWGWAENVAAGHGSVPEVMTGWMGSSGHRANILNASFNHVGLGLANAGDGTPYWTQVFGNSGTC